MLLMQRPVDNECQSTWTLLAVTLLIAGLIRHSRAHKHCETMWNSILSSIVKRVAVQVLMEYLVHVQSLQTESDACPKRVCSLMQSLSHSSQ